MRPATLAIALLLGTASASGATITLIPGAGFADTTPVAPEGGNPGTTLGQQRTNVFNAAAAAWGGALSSSQAIKVSASFETLSCGPSSGTLGQAGATNNFSLGSGGAARFYAVALAEALTASNLNGADAEIIATFNARIDLNDTGCLGNTRWYYGLSGPAPAGTIALYPTLMHELGHGLGFAALLCTTSGGCTNTNPPTPQGGYFFGIPDSWADFLRDNNVEGSGVNGRWIELTDAQRAAALTRDPNIVWDGMSVTTNIGAQAAAALDETRLRMFAPNPFQSGSSISHFHEAAVPNLLMEPFADADVFLQTDLTDCLFADIGWISSRCATVINTAPTLDAIASPPAIPVDSGPQTIDLAGIGDGDALVQTLTVSAVSSNPTLVPDPVVSYTDPDTTGSLEYTPAAGRSGSSQITVTVADDGGIANGGEDSRERIFTVTVSATSVRPVATNLSAAETYTEDTPRNLTDIVVFDPDSGAISASLTLSNATLGRLTTASSGAVTSTYDSSSGEWSASGVQADVNALLAAVSFVPNADVNAGFSIATRVSDGISAPLVGNKAVTGIAVNDAPAISSVPPPAATEGQVYAYDATRTDVDGPGQSWSLLAAHTCGGSIAASTGALRFTPAGPTPPASCMLAIRVCDGGSPDACASQSRTVEITAVNSAPTNTAPGTATMLEDTLLALEGANRLAVSDADDDILQTTLTVARGALSLDANAGISFSQGDGVDDATMVLSGRPAALDAALATLRYRPAADDHSAVFLGFTAADAVSQVSRSVSIEIQPVTDIVDDAVTTAEDVSLVFNALTGSNGASADGFSADPILVAVTQGAAGNVSFEADGSITYVPDADVAGTDTFTYEVESGGRSETGSVTVEVRAINDAPTLDPIPDPATLAVDAAAQNLTLTGISAGAGESQSLQVSASSDNAGLIPDPLVNYGSPGSEATLGFRPLPGGSGIATITVIVRDDGGTDEGGVDSVSRRFVLRVGDVDAVFDDGFED